MLFSVLFAAAALLAGAIAAVTGFGIGSLLTPLLALQVGTKLAVAAVAIPHFVGSAQRFWMFRRHVDRRVVLGFQVPKESFVATATAIALFVDVARLPVYLATQGREIIGWWRLLLAATVAIMVGTMLGTRLLSRLPQHGFRRVVAVLLLLLGLYMITAGSG